jgi:hypothetical protein
MVVLIEEYQLEWQAEHGPRCRYRLATEQNWSGWLALKRRDYALVALLLSQQPVYYDQLRGTVCAGPGYAALAAAPAAVALSGPPAALVPTPNSGDDAEAAQELLSAGAGGAAAPAPPQWRPARSLQVLLDQVNRQYPGRNKLSDGTIGDSAHQHRASDHNPNAAGVVTALDITHDPARKCDAGQLAHAIRTSRDSRVKYLIWNRQIANSAPIDGQPAWAWRAYTGTNPHDKHIHISVKGDPAAYDATTPWSLPPLA